MAESRDGLSRNLDCNSRQVKNLGTPTELADATYCTDNVLLIMPVSTAGALGASLLAAPAQHVHAGLHSVAADFGAQILGDATLVSGFGVVLAQSGSTIVILNAIKGTVGATPVVASELLSWMNVGGMPRLVAMDISDGANINLSNPAGFALADTAAAGTVTVIKSGIISVADGRWDLGGGVPAVTDVGKLVFASLTDPGKVSLSGQNSANNVQAKVGMVARGGAGSVQIDIQFDSLPPAIA